MDTDDIPLKLTDTITLPSTNPVVIIGPNGSGKTRFAVNLSRKQNAEFIGALRNIALNDDVPMQPLARAIQELTNQINNHRSEYWNLSNEIHYLFSKLLAEDATSAMRVRDSLLASEQPLIEKTKLMQLRSAWQEFFPGREIQFETYTPKVKSMYTGQPLVYPAKQMSDGERVALYLGARVLDTKPGLIIVDEPEVHFHSRLATRFWNTMENLRPDLRFVYITHDLTFALSRRDAQFVVIRPNLNPEVIPISTGIPKDLAESILGAASFSVYANRIVFCEGDESTDFSLYTSWFNTPTTAVIPVGGCREVLQCTNAFCNQSIVSGVKAIGIIDRDYWPEQYLKTIPEQVKPLPVHELENLYCLPEIFQAIGQHLSLTQQEIENRYEEFIFQAKERFKGALLAKQIIERFKRRCTGGLDVVVNGLPVGDDLTSLESQCATALEPGNWGFKPEIIFQEERLVLEKSLSSKDPKDFLSLFPGKVFINLATKTLGLEVKAYKELVNRALLADSKSKMWEFRKSLETALLKVLPAR